MNRYLIESEHTEEDCLHVLDLFVYHGFVNHFDWGCYDGVHKGYAIIEAESKDHALMSVPPLIKHKAHATLLSKFTPEIVKSFHEEEKA